MNINDWDRRIDYYSNTGICQKMHVNEADVLIFLCKRGYKEVKPEGMTTSIFVKDEQAYTMQKAFEHELKLEVTKKVAKSCPT